MKKNHYVFLCLFLFVLGAYIWQIKNHGLTHLIVEKTNVISPSPTKDHTQSVLFEVGKDPVTEADIEWEYQNILREIDNLKGVSPFDAAERYVGKELGPLKKRIASGLIERKVLFSYIQKDSSFNVQDPSRYVVCLADWNAIINCQNKSHMENAWDRDKLKARLCERSLIDQYLEEKIFKSISVKSSEVEQYYKDHKSEFRQYEAVMIRHILFVDEPTARKWRSVLTLGNFEDMAKAHSITPEGKAGGRIGPYYKGMLPAVFDTAFSMKVGEISDVLRSNYGYHVILLEEKIPKRNLDLTRATPEVTKILFRKKKEEAYDRWLEQALVSVKVLANKDIP